MNSDTFKPDYMSGPAPGKRENFGVELFIMQWIKGIFCSKYLYMSFNLAEERDEFIKKEWPKFCYRL